MLQFPMLLLAMLPTGTTPPVPHDFDALPEGEEKDELRRIMQTTPSEERTPAEQLFADPNFDPFVDSSNWGDTTYLDGNYAYEREMAKVYEEQNHYTMPPEKDLVAAVRLYAQEPSSSVETDVNWVVFDDILKPPAHVKYSLHPWSKTQPTCRIEVVGSPHKSGLTRVQRRDVQVQANYMKANLPENYTDENLLDMAKMLNSRLQGYAFTRDSGQWVASRPQANKEPRAVRRAAERAQTRKVVRILKRAIYEGDPKQKLQDVNLNILYQRPGFNSRPADTLASRAAQAEVTDRALGLSGSY